MWEQELARVACVGGLMIARRQQIISEVATEAVASSFDAHGYGVPAQDVWDFMRQMLGDIEDPRYEELPELMPPQFQREYEAQCIARASK